MLLPSLKAIRVFEAAARHANFSRAADELSVTQSAVSRQVQQLEQQLGQALFIRSGPRLRLTPNGKDYLDVVQEGLGIIQRGTSRLFRRDAQPVLTLSLLPSLVSQWFVPRIGDFEQQHPKISLRLSASHQVVDFARTPDIDAAIRIGRGRWQGVTAVPLLEDVLFPVCSPHVARRLKVPSDLLNERLLVDDPHWDFWGLWATAAGIQSGKRHLHRLSDDSNVQIQATILGHGITLAPGILAADELRAGRLVCPFKICVLSPVQYYFVYPPDRDGDAALQAMLAWLKAAAQSTVEGMESHWGTPRDSHAAIKGVQ